MSVKGFKFNNVTHRYDYNYLDNLPDIQTDDTLSIQGKAADAKATGDQIDALTERMDTFTSLPEGSTSGDAELIDARTGYDGTEYGSAGTAIRTQVTNLHSAVNAKANQSALTAEATARENADTTLKNNIVDNYIVVDDEQPSSSINKIWIPETMPEGTQVPTYEEFSDALNSIASDAVYFVQGTKTTSDSVTTVTISTSKEDILANCFNNSLPMLCLRVGTSSMYYLYICEYKNETSKSITFKRYSLNAYENLQEETVGVFTSSNTVTTTYDVSVVKTDISELDTATDADVGKALKAKTVTNGKVTEWEFGETATIDNTLTIAGAAADAKAVGDEIANLRDMLDLTEGTYLEYGYISNTGASKADANGNRRRTGFIAISPGSTLQYIGESDHANVNGISFYDKNGIYISGNSNGGEKGTYVEVTAPSNAYFARISTIRTINHKIGLKRVSGDSPDKTTLLRIAELEKGIAYIDTAGSNLTTRYGTKTDPFRTIGYAIQRGFRKIYAKPGYYNEKVSLTDGSFELSMWDDNESYSDSFRSKVEIIYGTILSDVASTATSNVYSASYTAESGTNIYKVFVDHSVNPTTQGSLSLEYNAMLVGDKPTSGTDGNNRQRLYTPVLTETELSAQGTFWYDGSGTIKFHPWNNILDDTYIIPNDDADNGFLLTNLDKVTLNDVRVVGFYTNCAYIKGCPDVTVNASEFGYSGKGMGLRLDNCNAEVIDCHAFGCSTDGFNLHEYGHSDFIGCTSYYNGDDGISHHQGCTGVIDGGEWAYNGSGGVTPSFGSQIEVKNIYAHDNLIGLQFLGQSGKRRKIRCSNNLLIDNSQSDLYVNYYDLTSWNCVYGSLEMGTYGTISEHNNNARSTLNTNGIIAWS